MNPVIRMPWNSIITGPPQRGRGGLLRGGMPQQPSRPGGAPRALMDLAFGQQRNETWFDEPQASSSKKTKANVDNEVEMYYHEELMEKLVNIKGVSCQPRYIYRS